MLVEWIVKVLRLQCLNTGLLLLYKIEQFFMSKILGIHGRLDWRSTEVPTFTNLSLSAPFWLI